MDGCQRWAVSLISCRSPVPRESGFPCFPWLRPYEICVHPTGIIRTTGIIRIGGKGCGDGTRSRPLPAHPSRQPRVDASERAPAEPRRRLANSERVRPLGGIGRHGEHPRRIREGAPETVRPATRNRGAAGRSASLPETPGLYSGKPPPSPGAGVFTEPFKHRPAEDSR